VPQAQVAPVEKYYSRASIRGGLSQKVPSIQFIVMLIRFGSLLAHYNPFED